MNDDGLKAVSSILNRISGFLIVMFLVMYFANNFPIQFSWFIIISGFLTFLYRVYKKGSNN